MASMTLKDIIELESVNEANLQKIKTVYGKRLERALNTIEGDRVHKYIFEPSNRIIWVVTGNERDYWIIPDIYCNCNDFYMNVVSKKKYDACYHLLAKVLAERLDHKYKTWNVKDDRYLNLMKEWKEV